MVDTGCVCDKTIIGGKLGVFSFSQANVIWSNLKYSCVVGNELVMCFDTKLNDLFLHFRQSL